MFAYLKKHHNAEMVFDPSEPEMDESLFPAPFAFREEKVEVCPDVVASPGTRPGMKGGT